jgi:HD-like signal output (HDOD) protein
MQAIDYAKNATQSFALPDICVRLRTMLDDKNSAIEDVGELVALDPALTSRLLKLANSSLFSFPSQIDSISKAVSVIGGEALYNLVMAETASSAFEHFGTENIDLQRFWKQSIYASLVAKELAKQIRLRGSERFFLLGLLHNLGEVVVASQSPELAAKCENYDEYILPWERQHKVLGFTYAQCSAQVMSLWRLPEPLCYPVAQQHDVEKALELKEIAVIYVAARAALSMVSVGLYSEEQLIEEKVLALLAIDLDDLSDVMKFALREAGSMLSMMKN